MKSFNKLVILCLVLSNSIAFADKDRDKTLKKLTNEEITRIARLGHIPSLILIDGVILKGRGGNGHSDILNNENSVVPDTTKGRGGNGIKDDYVIDINAGSSFGKNIATIAKNIGIVWKTVCEKEVSNQQAYCEYLDIYLNKLNDIQFSGANQVFVKDKDGAILERDAVNDGLSSIAINTSRWKSLNTGYQKSVEQAQVELILHEVLSLDGLNLDASDNYSGSSAVISIIDHLGYDFKMIASVTQLPLANSVSLQTSGILKSGREYIQSILEKDGLSVTTGYARYTLTVNLKCLESSAEMQICALAVSMVDNFKQDSRVINGIEQNMGLISMKTETDYQSTFGTIFAQALRYLHF